MARPGHELGGLPLLALALLLSGCSGLAQPAAAGLEIIPSATSLPPTLTSTSSLTPTNTPSPTPTLHPLSIDYLRSAEIPGSVITIEEELPRGANYYRYLASCWSEGLKIYALLTVPYGEPPENG